MPLTDAVSTIRNASARGAVCTCTLIFAK